MTAAPAVVPVWVRLLREGGSFGVWAGVMSLFVYAEHAVLRVPQGPAAALMNAVAGLLMYWVCVRVIERREPVELSLQWALRDYSAGFGLGAIIFAVTIGIYALAGWYHVLAVTWSPRTIASGLALSISTAVSEEIVLRGYCCRSLQSSFGSWAAIGLSAGLFGALHQFNPNATWWSSVAIAIEAGVLLAATFVFTGRLWTAIGIHTSWNFTEGTIFGTPVSGLDFAGITKSVIQGPVLFTGGAFGPEASIVTVLLCSAISAGFIVAIVRRDKIVAPAWVRSRRHRELTA